MSVSTISPVELAQLYHSGKKIELIDVRTPFEYWEVRVDFARNIPLDQLEPAKLIASQNGSASEPLYFICRSGYRSLTACEEFLKSGYANVVNVEGGTLACEHVGLPLTRG